MGAFEEGVARFNAGRFWDAHESWEELWLRAEGDDKRFLQGLIQLAAAYHHISRGTMRGAGRLLKAALAKLDSFPVHYRGIERRDAEIAASRHLDELGRTGRIAAIEFPKLRYN
jgi:uncharacterized protein